MYIYISDMKFAQLSCTGQCLVDVLDVAAESSKNSQSIHIRKIQCHKLYSNFIRKKTNCFTNETCYYWRTHEHMYHSDGS